MRATISILGLNNFDESIWDNFQVPSQANRQDIIDEILLECCDFELLYPDWDVMKGAIGLWSRKELPIWQRLYDAKEYEYNPLWNVDAEIKEVRDVTDNSNYTDNTQGSDSRTGAIEGSDSETFKDDSDLSTTGNVNGTDSRSRTENLTENVDENIDNNKVTTQDSTNKKTGTEGTVTSETANSSILHQSNTFNSGAMIDNAKDITNSQEDGTSTTTFNTTIKDDSETTENGSTDRDLDRTQNLSGNESGTHQENESSNTVLDRTTTTNGSNRQDSTESGTHIEDKTGTTARATHDDYHVIRQGNIGVTSSQQLLTEEWEVSQLDPEQYIIDSFKQRFCLLLY